MQQINLYVQELRPQRQILPARQGLLLLTGVLGLALLAQAFVLWQARQASAAQQVAELRLSAVQQDYQRLEQALAERVVDDRLRITGQQLTQQLDGTRALMRALQPDLSQRASLSPVLEALARQHERGLWLSQIQLAPDEGLLALRGNLIRPDLLPVYLRRLQSEPAFSALQFNVMRLQEQTGREESNQESDLQFYVSTQEQPEARP